MTSVNLQNLTLTQWVIASASVWMLWVVGQALWCQFVAYPLVFEKQLRQGKPWVYIPLRWNGLHRQQAMWVSRLFVLGHGLFAMWIWEIASGKTGWSWRIPAAILGFVIGMRLHALWLGLRYRQQEDSYFHLHDSLREKLENEGKDYSEAAFRNLANYQHHQLMRKADEEGLFRQTLKQQAKLSRERRKKAPTLPPVEA